MAEFEASGSAPLKDHTAFLAQYALDELLKLRAQLGLPRLQRLDRAGAAQQLRILTEKVEEEPDQTVKPGRIATALTNLVAQMQSTDQHSAQLHQPPVPGLCCSVASDAGGQLCVRVFEGYDMEANAILLTFQVAVGTLPG